MKTAAIVLAAGRSSRFGDGNKLLALLNGKPLVRHAVDAALEAGLGEIVVVTGHMAETVGATVSDTGVRKAHNADFAQGMAESIKVGIAALAPDTQAVFLMLADMPLLRAKTLRKMMMIARDNPEKQAIIPVENARRGNPVLLRAALFPALHSLAGDSGARRILEMMPEHVLEMPCDDPGIHADFDTRAALEAISVKDTLQ